MFYRLCLTDSHTKGSIRPDRIRSGDLERSAAGCSRRRFSRPRRATTYLRFFVDSLTVVLGFDLTVLCFTKRPVIAERPRLPPELGLALPATIQPSCFWGT